MKDFIKKYRKKIIKHIIIFLILFICVIHTFTTFANRNHYYCKNPYCDYYEELLKTEDIKIHTQQGIKIQYCSHCGTQAQREYEEEVDNDEEYYDDRTEENKFSLAEKIIDLVVGKILDFCAGIVGLLVTFIGNIMTKIIINDPAYLIDVGLNIESKIPVINGFIQKLNEVIKLCCLSIIIILILKQTFMTYVLWQSGSPDENPFEIIFRMGLALAMIVCITDLYTMLLSLFKNEYVKLIDTINVSEEFSFDISLFKDLFTSDGQSGFTEIQRGFKALVGNIASIIVIFTYIKYCFTALLHIIQNGLEILIVRASFPIFCLEIIKPNNNFQSMLMLMFKCVFNIVLSSFLVGLSYMVICNMGNFDSMRDFVVIYFSALALIKMASGSNAILNQFFGNTVGQLGSSVGTSTAGRLVNKIPVVSKFNSWLKG